MNKMNKARELLINKYMEALEQNQLPWMCGWNNHQPKNAITGTKYHGINNALLSYVASEKCYKGNRWCTFTQIADKDGIYHKGEKWHLKSGSESVPVEYWYVFNTEEKKVYSWKDYNKAISEGISPNDFVLCNKTYLVFNEDCIEGISPEITVSEEINENEFINNVIDNMNVDYEEIGTSAYYNPYEDIVVVPPKDSFYSQYNYNATVLHELCHATGHANRLNRDIANSFGTPTYAKEELRAEISSSFLMQDINAEFDSEHIENHKAYIQSWIKVLKDDPNELFRAIKDAEIIEKYICEKGNLEINKENEVEEIEM